MYAIVSLWFCVKTPQYLTGGVALLDFRMRSLIARPNSANLDVWILIATNKVTESFCGNFPDSTLQLTSYRYLTSDKKLFDHSDFKSTITRSGWNLRLSVRNMGKSAAMHRRDSCSGEDPGWQQLHLLQSQHLLKSGQWSQQLLVHLS